MTNLMYFSLFGGILLLIYGIRQTGEGFQKAAGPHLKQVLSYLTKNRVLGLMLGIVITILTQSSSATTVMLVGFVNSGIMSFSQTLGVILGADIGTTITVQLISFKVLDYSVLLIGLGLLAMYSGKHRVLNDLGQGILGFGFIFLSMKIMSDSVIPLRDSEVFRLLLVLLADNPFMGLVVAALFTSLVHSSAVTIGVALSLASQGLIDLPHAIPIIFGANIGTCSTAIIAGYSGPLEARRVAYAHTMFKVLGVALFYPFMGQMTQMVEATAPDPMRQIANAHTFFNVALAVMFLPFSGWMAWLMENMVTSEGEAAPFGPKYLDEGVLSTPSLALSQAAREADRMADIVQDMFSKTINAFRDRDQRLVEEIEETDDKVDKLDRGIRFFLAKLSRTALTDEQSRREFSLLAVTSDLENIGDIIDKNLMSLARKRIKGGVSFTREGFEEIITFHAKISENFSLAVAAFIAHDVDLAGRVVKNKERITELEKECRAAHIQRLKQGLPESFETSAIHLDILSNMLRINSYITHMAITLLENSSQPAE